MRAQLPRELHAYGDMVGNRAGLETGAPSITYQGQEGPQAGGQPRPEELIIQLQEAYVHLGEQYGLPVIVNTDLEQTVAQVKNLIDEKF